jgi:hypothetical protein
MRKPKQSRINRMRDILAKLECEILVLYYAAGAPKNLENPELSTGIGMIGLASACVAKASAAIGDPSVVSLLEDA